jgi:glutaminyl-tRNA synthetase
MRRRGYTPKAIRNFCEAIGVAKTNSTVEVELLEHHLRQDLNLHAPRVMGVLKPLRLIIDNYPKGQVEWLDAENNPEDSAAGSRQIPFSGELYVEQDDFQEEAPKKWFRLSPGREVRLKHAYYVTCVSAAKDASGNVVELHCTYDPESRGGWTKDSREVKGTLHWVSAAHAIAAEVRLYERLFTVPDPLDHEEPFTSFLNPNSEAVLTGCLVEPGLANAAPGTGVQFLRQGYFCVDPDSTAGKLVFNRTVSLRDTWAKMASSAARA